MIDIAGLCMGAPCSTNFVATIQEYHLGGLRGAADEIVDRCDL